MVCTSSSISKLHVKLQTCPHISVLRAGCIITRDTGIKYEEQIQLSLTLLYISYFTLKSGGRLFTQKLQTESLMRI